jgi:kynurenine formamidase
MPIIDLSLAHYDEMDPVAAAVGKMMNAETSVRRKYFPPKKEPDVVFVDSWLSIFAHAGTHLDCPRHIYRWGKTTDEVALDRFMGPACLLDFSSKGADEAISAEDLEAHAGLVRENDIVLLRTDFTDKFWGSDAYLRNSPFLTGDGANWLVDKGVKAAGFDFLQEEEVKKIPENVPENYVVHRTLLGNGIIQIEHMTNLSAIPQERFEVIALPLKMPGIEGSPCRAVAVVD